MATHLLTGDKSFWTIFVIVLARYLVLASLAFLIFYVFRRHTQRYRKIQPKFPPISDYWREVSYSVLTAVVFALIGFAVFATPISRYTQAYWTISDYGIAYFIVSIVMMIVVHDAYFYWTHRWMHQRRVFKYVHKVHHLSTNPSPWAAMAFHPLESFIEGSVIILIAFLFPVHPLAIGLFLLFMMSYNVYGHLGYELYPRGFSRSRIGRWINTSINHNLHHQHFDGNYGLYFLWWDRWMGTLRQDYDQRFEEVKNRTTD